LSDWEDAGLLGALGDGSFSGLLGAAEVWVGVELGVDVVVLGARTACERVEVRTRGVLTELLPGASRRLPAVSGSEARPMR
jgi:hypothetical protein